MNPYLNRLQPYPFERLKQLKDGVEAPKALAHIALSIGEPKHTPPEFALSALTGNIEKTANYPTTHGLPALRNAISQWATRRFSLAEQSLSAESHILPVNGTREALFAFTQVAVDNTKPSPTVLMPNPFYQIYEGAALMAGAEPVFLNCTENNGFLPDFASISEATWENCQLLFICTPGNPTGAVMNLAQLKELIALADKYDFILASDECYSELYFDESAPPAGLLQACAELGRNDYARCVVFHSLSKRSNLPGMRSGFVAGDKSLIAQFLQYRTYHGCAMPLPTQLASITAWEDENHVIENRRIYREKFDAVLEILGDSLDVTRPDAGFYLWPRTSISETEFTRKLFEQQNITVLPGSFLARDTAQGNPGSHRIRIALVASKDECIAAAKRIKTFCKTL